MDVAVKVGLIDASLGTAEAIGAAFDDTSAGRASADWRASLRHGTRALVSRPHWICCPTQRCMDAIQCA